MTLALIKIAVPVLVVLLIAFVAWRLTRPTKNVKRERELEALLDEANRVFNDLFTIREFDEMDILTTDSKDKIQTWKNKYRREINK